MGSDILAFAPRVLARVFGAFVFLGAGLPVLAEHGGPGHLPGSGAYGNIEFVGKLKPAAPAPQPGTIADVAVSPDGNHAYLANWGRPTCAAVSEAGGINNPDAGAWIIDISDPARPRQVGFIPSHQDTRPGEGMQVIRAQTKYFSGDLLVMNNEQCGKNGKGGISLWDVTNPLRPLKLSDHFGDRSAAVKDANDTHSAFAWQAGENLYAVMVDNFETTDVDILDITNPRQPRLIRELSLDETFPQIAQTPLGLVEVFLHDVVVKRINGNWIMLLSYWDGGFVQLNVNDPARPTLVGDTDFESVDPLLLARTGMSQRPEGNAHQAEFTADNRYFIGTDEDFTPYGAVSFQIATGPNAGAYRAVPVPGSAPITILADGKFNGPVVYGGYGCPASAPIPRPEQVPNYLASLQPGEEKIVVLQRGPSGDPSAPEGACFPGEKAHQAVLAGWDAVLLANRHDGASEPAVPFCGSGAFVDRVVAVCTTHDAMHKLFGQATSYTYPDGPRIGTVGQRVLATAAFDGWGYVHLFANNADPATKKFPQLDAYAIPQAHDPAFAVNFGDLTVHEVATDPQNPAQAYLAYYAAGLRSLRIRNGKLVEVGGYSDPNGNNFWGVEAFVRRDGKTYILASDRDSGLWIFRAR